MCQSRSFGRSWRRARSRRTRRARVEAGLQTGLPIRDLGIRPRSPGMHGWPAAATRPCVPYSGTGFTRAACSLARRNAWLWNRRSGFESLPPSQRKSIADLLSNTLRDNKLRVLESWLAFRRSDAMVAVAGGQSFRYQGLDCVTSVRIPNRSSGALFALV
jgi:hypothetical protein